MKSGKNTSGIIKKKLSNQSPDRLKKSHLCLFRAISLTFLLFFSISIYSDEKKSADKAADNDSSPRANASSDSIFQTLEFYNLRQLYEAEKKDLPSSFKNQLENILQKYIAEYDEFYEKQKLAGNTKGMGIARSGKNLFSNALEELQKNGSFIFPENIRKEIKESVEKCQKEQKEILNEIEKEYKKLDEKYKSQFEELYKQVSTDKETLTPEILNQKFKDFLKAEIKKTEISKQDDERFALLQQLGVTDPNVLQKSGTAGASSAAVIASSGKANNWIDIAEWTGEMVAMEVVEIPVLNQKSDFTTTQRSVLGGGSESKLTYRAIRPMPPYPNYVFRLLRSSGFKDVDVLSWPSEKNCWTLQIRTKNLQPGEQLPVKHAFVFQVSLPDIDREKLFGKNALSVSSQNESAETSSPQKNKKTNQDKIEKSSTKTTMTEITVNSVPSGAEIYVNDKQYTIPSGEKVYTPAKIKIPEGVYNIRLSKFGYDDKIIENLDTKTKPSINLELSKKQNAQFHNIKLPANANSWTNTKILVKKNDKISVEITGTWAPGKSSDKCGPEGLPNITKYYDYYSSDINDTRQDKTLPFGALLMKIGENGKINHIKTRNFQFSAIEGTAQPIFFDINEKEGKPRKTNTGALQISIVVIPAS